MDNTQEQQNQVPPAKVPTLAQQRLEKSGIVKPVAEADKKPEEPANPAAPPKPAETTPPVEAPAPPKPDDTALLAMLAERGISVGSLEDLKKPANAPVIELTPEQKAQQAKEKREKAISFGLQNKVFSQSEYDAAVLFESKDPLTVVKEEYIARAKKIDPEVDESELADQFEHHYFLLNPEEGVAYKTGQQALAAEYQRIKEARIGKIAGIEKAFDNHTTHAQRSQVYTQQLDELVNTGIPKTIDIPIGGKSYSAPIDPSELAKIKELYQTTDSMNALLDQTGKVDTAVLKEEILKDLVYKNLSAIVSEVANSLADERVAASEAGRKNIIRPNHTIVEAGGAPIPSLANAKMGRKVK